MAARQYTWKRIDLALQVVKELQQHASLELTLAGSQTELGARLALLAKEMGISDMIYFAGEVSADILVQFYARAAVYIQTSIYEPFGMSSLEAQSYGTPAVVWGDAGLKETVLDGKTGYHAEPYDIRDFASKVGFLLDDKKAWSEMSENAREWAALPRFSWERHTAIMEETLRKAVDRS